MPPTQIPEWRCSHGGNTIDGCRLTSNHLGSHLPRRCRRCRQSAVATVGNNHTPHCLRCGQAYDERLEQHPAIRGGAIVFRGSELPLEVVSGRLAAGNRWSDLLLAYADELIPDDIELARGFRRSLDGGES